MGIRLVALLLVLALPGIAASLEEQDPPGRVARLSAIQGQVSLQAEHAQGAEEAMVNRPLTSGDRLITEAHSRAELGLGIAAVRLDELTDLSISNLDSDIAQFEVNSGSISVSLRELGSEETFEIDTAKAAIRLLKPGDYRVDVLTDGTSVLAVRQGEAEIDSGSGPVSVREGEQAQLSPNDSYANVVALAAPDAFDEWSLERERQLGDSPVTRYVSRDIVGYEDLHRYGTWYSEPSYGYVWSPFIVSVGWAPYRFGRWIWMSPWGWTWVDNASWGFAPFHYGRWAYLRHRWCWVPGPRHRNAVYAPAVVAWSGGHSHGDHHSRDRRPREWVPLAPGEVYVPRHRASPRYLRNVNVSNTLIANNTHITNVARDRVRDIRYRNHAVSGEVTSPSHRTLDSQRGARTLYRPAVGSPLIRELPEARAPRNGLRRDETREATELPPGRSTIPSRQIMTGGRESAYRVDGVTRPALRPQPQRTSPQVSSPPRTLYRSTPPPASSVPPRSTRTDASSPPRGAVYQRPSNSRSQSRPSSEARGRGGLGERTR